jgi:hypothetical protein
LGFSKKLKTLSIIETERRNYSMHNLEWLQRVFGNLEAHLYGKCKLIDKLVDEENLNINLDETAKHPRIHVSVEIEELNFYGNAITIHFDPYNQEFYLGLHKEQEEIRVILKDVELILEHIHNAIHQLFESAVKEALKQPTPHNALFLEWIQKFIGELELEDFEVGCQCGCECEENCSCNECDCRKQHDCECECCQEYEEEASVDLLEYDPRDIEWITDEVIAFEKTLGSKTFIISFQLGRIKELSLPHNGIQLVLARIETSLVDGKVDSKTVQLLPLYDDEVDAILELLLDYNEATE